MSRQQQPEFPYPVCSLKLLLSVLALVLVCGVLAWGLAFIVTLEQALLAASLPVGCVWALKEVHSDTEDTKAAWTIRILAAAAILVAFVREDASPCILPICALASMAANSTKIPLGMPAGSFVPYSALTALIVAVLSSEDESQEEALAAAGLMHGPFDFGPFPWIAAALSAIVSSSALVMWSVCYVKGNHGRIQESMGPTLTPARVVIYSVINGIGEELEFRMLIFGGLVARPSHHPPSWLGLSLVLQAAFFAVLHFSGGFPSGISGVALLFTWALFLGSLLLWTGSIIPAILLHIEVDIVVFTILLLQERKRERMRARNDDDAVGKKESACVALDDRVIRDIGEYREVVYGSPTRE